MVLWLVTILLPYWHTFVCQYWHYTQKEEVAEWSKAADCKSVRKLALVRIQFFSIMKNARYKSFYKDLFFNENIEVTKMAEDFWKIKPNPKTISRGLKKYNFTVRGYNLERNSYFNPTKTLALNFTRGRFFPTIQGQNKNVLFFLSLGLMAKFLLKGKAFTKSKTVYLLLASFLRKVLLFASFKNMYLFVKKTPLFFKEIMSTINDPVISIYKNPFSQNLFNEKENPNGFTFPLIVFINNKAYGHLKVKQKGRLKRKIARRITLVNKVLD